MPLFDVMGKNFSIFVIAVIVWLLLMTVIYPATGCLIAQHHCLDLYTIFSQLF